MKPTIPRFQASFRGLYSYLLLMSRLGYTLIVRLGQPDTLEREPGDVVSGTRLSVEA